MLYGYTSTSISQCRHARADARIYACTHTHTHTHTHIYIVLFCVWTIFLPGMRLILPQSLNTPKGQIISLVPNKKTSVSCSKRKRAALWACICLVSSEIMKEGKSEIWRRVVRICSYQTTWYHISEDFYSFVCHKWTKVNVSPHLAWS